MVQLLNVGSRTIGPKYPVFVVAELSANHKSRLDRAHHIIDAAADAGCDAVKLQTYTAETLTIKSRKKWFRVKGTKLWDGKTLFALYQEASTPWSWHKELQEHAKKRGLIFFSTPFDSTSVDFLEKLQVPLYKVASFEAEDTPLLTSIGKTSKPVIVSRGLSDFAGIKQTINTLYKNNTPAVAVLHCVSNYPAKPETMNLSHIPQIAADFDVVSGLSDHALTPHVSLAAVSLGASIIEKHLTLKRRDGGPDAAFSMEPEEMKQLVWEIRRIENWDQEKKKSYLEKIPHSSAMIGKSSYVLSDEDLKNASFKRSLFVVSRIKKGDIFTKRNIRSIRPGFGLAPRYYEKVLGKRAATTISSATPLSWHHITPDSHIRVRQARKSDSKQIWEIRNHVLVRNQSGNSDLIQYSAHIDWFSKKYFSYSPHRCFVLEEKNNVIGYCRMDKIDEKTYEVSHAIKPGNHGRGFGSFLLSTAIHRLPKNSNFTAQIKKGNTASYLFFTKNKFVVTKTDETYYYVRYTHD